MNDRDLITTLERTTAALTAMVLQMRFHERDQAEASDYWHAHGLGNAGVETIIDEANRALGACRPARQHERELA